MNITLNPQVLLWIKDAFIILLVVGATVYNIMQDRKIEELKGEIDILKDQLGAAVDCFDEMSDQLCNDLDASHEFLFEDICNIYDRLNKYDKKIKEVSRK